VNEISDHKKLIVINALNMLAEEGEICFEDSMCAKMLAGALKSGKVKIFEEKWATGIPVDEINEWIDTIWPGR
jgi:hypothetical protein